jgi:thioredoxin 1
MRARTPMVLAAMLTMLIALATCTRDKPEPGTKALDKASALQSMATPMGDSSAVLGGSTPAALPRMIDLGRGKCIPCKKMEPILEELKLAYAGKAVIETINLDQEPGAGKMYGLRLIPTQIFFDASGTEVWRHEGFLPRDAIVAKFTEMGVVLREEAEPQGSFGAEAGLEPEHD